MSNISTICEFLNQTAPMSLAEDWDNVGLLVGDRTKIVRRIMTCLTVTPESVEEAVERSADLIVSHHPIPFQPLKKITTDQTAGRMLLSLIQNSIAVYSPHTGFDSALDGINQKTADRLALQQTLPILPGETDERVGSGRYGVLANPVTLREFAESTRNQFELKQIRLVGNPDQKIRVVGVACGSGGSFLASAVRVGCDTLVTGETNFHSCLEARALGKSLCLLGHYGSERFAVECLAEGLQSEFSELQCWASERESDPVWWL